MFPHCLQPYGGLKSVLGEKRAEMRTFVSLVREVIAAAVHGEQLGHSDYVFETGRLPAADHAGHNPVAAVRVWVQLLSTHLQGQCRCHCTLAAAPPS